MEYQKKKENHHYMNNKKGSKGFNLLNVNALYDICNKLYLDATIQTYRKTNEFKGLIQMIKRFPLKKSYPCC
jgi:hypothetical protein